MLLNVGSVGVFFILNISKTILPGIPSGSVLNSFKLKS